MRETPWTTQDEHLIQLFKSVNRLHRRVFDRQVSSFNVGHTLHMLLMYLSHVPEPPSQKQIAEQFEVSSAAVALSLKKLEADGFVTREADASDARSNRIRLTQKGKDLTECTHQRFAEIDRTMFDALSEEERAMFARCLEKMHDGLEDMLSSKGE